MQGKRPRLQAVWLSWWPTCCRCVLVPVGDVVLDVWTIHSAGAVMQHCMHGRDLQDVCVNWGDVVWNSQTQPPLTHRGIHACYVPFCGGMEREVACCWHYRLHITTVVYQIVNLLCLQEVDVASSVAAASALTLQDGHPLSAGTKGGPGMERAASVQPPALSPADLDVLAAFLQLLALCVAFHEQNQVMRTGCLCMGC